MRSHISIPQWLSLDRDARRQFKDKFLIRGSGPTEILHDANGVTREISDGVMDKDLDVAFSIEHMIEYLKADLPWYREDLIEYLFKLSQDKFYGRTVEWDERRDDQPGVEAIGAIDPSSESVEPKRKGRPRKEPQAV